MKIHCLAVILVTLAGTLFQITASEWCVCLLLFALVASLELVNTAIEAAVDLVTEEKKPLAKLANWQNWPKIQRPGQCFSLRSYP